MFKLTSLLILWACLAVGVLRLTAPARGASNAVLLAGGGSKLSSTGPKTDVASSESILSSGGQATSAGVAPVLEPRRRPQLAEKATVQAPPRRASPPSPPSPSPASKTRRRPPPRPPAKTHRSKPPPSPQPPLGRRGQPPPSPPSPSLPPRNGSRVCAAMTLVSPTNASGAPTYNFGKQVSCSKLAQIMITNLTDAAAAVGAALSVPFTQERCTSDYAPAASPPLVPHILVCGSFLNDKAAAKLQTGFTKLRAAMANWQHFALGRPLTNIDVHCPPPGFKVSSMVWSDVPGLVVNYFEPSCF